MYQIQRFRSYFVVILGDFNSRFKSWWNENIKPNEGSQIDSLTTTYDLQQLISDSTHILSNSSTCTEFCEISKNTFSLEHLRTTASAYCKFSLINEYPSPYQRLVWDCKKANINSIKQALYQIDWPTILSSKDVHQQVNMLNSIMLNVFTNYVSNKVITIDNKDQPWWAEFIKSKIRVKIVSTKLFRIVPRMLWNIIHCNRLL